ncbi:hypothetical protein O3M35_001367 [Rhynocoris fuscipes]|uniref:Nucleosome assembly protein 1-like 1 n=1 Tax=Rhynocoris fuscipes TaxID=488301 RepID=A0AAW1DTR6_9HEMI
MAGSTDVGGRGEVMNDTVNEDTVRKFLKDTNAPLGALSEIYAKDQLLMLYALPDPIKRRLRALKKLQISILNMESEFYNEVHSLEMKYHQKFKALYDKRAKIVTGKYEPNEDELHPEDNLPEIPPEVQAKLKVEQSKLADGPGIPNFWLTIFKNVGMLNEIIYTHDEDILSHLVDIRVVLKNNPMGFRLEFIFTPNEFFTNTVLTKDYEMKCCPEETDPFSFEGPEIRNTKGCKIDWKPGRDVTVKTVKKVQKHKAKGSVRTVLKTVKNESFFNFFSPPEIPEDNLTDIDEDIQMQLTADFEIGHYLRERVIPHAILFYTGEALEDEESYEDYDEEDDEEDEEESAASRSSEASSEGAEQPVKDDDEDEEDVKISSVSESEESGH